MNKLLSLIVGMLMAVIFVFVGIPNIIVLILLLVCILLPPLKVYRPTLIWIGIGMTIAIVAMLLLVLTGIILIVVLV